MPVMTIKINHIAMVAADFEIATHFWKDVIGLSFEGTEDNHEEAVRTGFFQAANCLIEVISPLTDDSGVAKYLNKRGPGMHHICLEVEDLDSVLDHLHTNGIELINETPKTGHAGVRYAFAHPRSTGGVMIEFYETGKDGKA
jgi:methylmalonyl-CoA/ethylmalonyl-CoA epimerase